MRVRERKREREARKRKGNSERERCKKKGVYGDVFSDAESAAEANHLKATKKQVFRSFLAAL